MNQWMMYLITASILMSINAVAAQSPLKEQLQVPQCLAAKIATSYEVLAENKQFKIIDIPATDVEALIHVADQIHCGRFINISHLFKNPLIAVKHRLAQHILQKKPVKPLLQDDTVYEIKHQDEVNAALHNVVPEAIWQTLSQLTAFHNRSATQSTGVETAHWLKKTFEAMALENARTDTEAFFVKSGRYQQPSLVTVIGNTLKAPALVIGAHMDTLDGLMPGADDDGSGAATIMETARVLLASKTSLKRPIYIIWYAAEERGLVGSQCVVSYFMQQSIPVKAVLQLDMTGYRSDPKDPSLWVFTDYTHKRLNDFITQLIETYIHVPVKYSKCGYGCSDHVSWNNVGIPAAFPCEAAFAHHNPYIHSAADTMDLLNLEHMTHFTQLALAFAIELSTDSE